MVEHGSLTGAAQAGYRSLGTPLLAALEALAVAPHGAWWADVLADADLLLAVRDRSLNVYYRGASLFRIIPAGDGVAAETHVKYLVRQRQALTRLKPNGRFALDPASAVWTRYEGPATLAEMKRAATPLAGLEKTGVHALVQASANVVDVEIALTGSPVADAAELDEAGVDAALLDPEAEAPPLRPRQDRLDVASLEERGAATEAWLVDALHATGFTGSIETIFGRGQAAGGVATLIGTMRLIARSDSPLSPGERVGVRALAASPVEKAAPFSRLRFSPERLRQAPVRIAPPPPGRGLG